MNGKLGWIGILGLVVAGGTAWWWQRETSTQLHDELASLREQHRELDRLRTENHRLAAAQISSAELEPLRSDHVAIGRLEAEIESLRTQVHETARLTEKKQAQPERFAVGSTVPSADWKNAGGKTSRAALESVLWAAAGGDVDVFANMLWIDPRARPAAQALLESLPTPMREQYGSPERLIAFLAIKDVPLGPAQVRAWSDGDERINQVQMVLSTPDAKKKDTNLAFIHQDDAWKLIVMEGVVTKYAALLKQPEAKADGR